MNMNRTKNVAMAIMIGLSAMCSRTALADTWTNENGVVWTYTVKDGVAAVGGGSYGAARAVPSDTAGDLVIPSELGGYPVVGINYWAFQGCKSLTSVTIPDTVTYINGGAFWGCEFTSVKIGSSVSRLDQSCFAGCQKLTSVEIPDSVTSIGGGAFADCVSLKFLKIGNGLTEITGSTYSSVLTGFGGATVTVNSSPFVGCTGLVRIECGESIAGRVYPDSFTQSTKLRYILFSGKIEASLNVKMPGASDLSIYVTHEAYPDGLPVDSSGQVKQWCYRPLKFLEGELPSPEKPYDFKFVTPQAEKGLIAYYKFDGDAKDSSGNENNGTPMGVTLTADRHGNENGAYHFDGNSYITVPNSSSLRGIEKNVSCSVWIRPTRWSGSTSEWMALLCKSKVFPRNIGFSFYKEHGFELVANESYLRLSQEPILDGWQMLAYTSDGTTVKVYLNGVCVGATNGAIAAKANDEPLLIGRDPPGEDECFFGDMDELRIYNRALSDAEIQEIYVSGETSGTEVQIHSPETDGLATATVLEGNPVYLSYAFRDAWGDEPIDPACVNRVTVIRESDGVVIGTDNDTVVSAVVGQPISRIGLEPESLQGLACGTYRVTVELNADKTLGETEYANNTNVTRFMVVPSVPVTFVSEDNTFAVRRYGAGRTYGSFPSIANRVNYDFIGWYSDVEDGVKIDVTNTVPEDAVTFYAHWAFRPSQTNYVSGAISTNTTWRVGDLYVVQGDLSLNSDATLTLEPGVIVKFAPGKSLTVNSGATLSAIGTRALPIIFTSIRDDVNGGDTNGDGDTTSPQPGDWARLHVKGAVKMDYCSLLYGSLGRGTDDILTVDGGTVTFANGKMMNIGKYAVGLESGHFYMNNAVIAEAYCAFRHGASDPIINSVIYNCNRLSNNDGQNLYNCIVVGVNEAWDWSSGKGNTYKNCVFWNEPGFGLQQLPGSALPKDGNIWANPLFVNPAKGDFRIAANSPCIDAGNGIVAPELDYYGKPRMNVDAVRPTGSVAANGAVPDIGIYEVPGDGNIPAPDLTVVSVTAPTTLTVGETVEISWTVQNIGDEPTEGAWRDEIEVVAPNGQVFSIGTITSQGIIRAGESATFQASVNVPAAPEGVVQVRVTANKHQDIFEALKVENNANAVAATLAVPTLDVPTDGTATTVTLSGDSDYGFSVAANESLWTQGGVLLIRGVGELDAWLGNGSIAAKDNAIRTAVKIADDTWLLQIPAGSEPRVTVRNECGDPVNVQLSLEVGDFFLHKVEVIKSGGSSGVTVRFWGNGFDESLVCWLEEGGTKIEATDVTVESGVFALATFVSPQYSLGSILIGSGRWVFSGHTYNFNVDKGGKTLGVNVTVPKDNESAANWYGYVDVPDSIRAGRTYVGTFRYGNAGESSMLAPYVTLTAKGETLIRLRETDAWSKTIAIMATSDSYPASVLKPGDSSKESFLYKTSGTTAEIEYAMAHASDVKIPWDDLMESLRPTWATKELWSVATGTLEDRMKEPKYMVVADTIIGARSINYGANETPDLLSWNKFLNCMRDDCDHLMKIGTPEKRVDRLWQMEINEALGNDTALSRLASATDLSRSARGLSLSFSRLYSASLRGRFTNGTLGYGWTDNFSTYAELQDDETLIFHLPSGGSYSFSKVTGAWQPEDVRDKTTLTETSTAYVLTYASGTVQTFAKSNRRTSSIRDNQGNELTFSYSGSGLAKVQHSDGQSLTFTYTGSKLTQVTDDQGRTAIYTYADNLLTSVTAFNGLVTQYEYLSAYGSLTNRALSRITYPDGSTREFTYDKKGRVATASVNGGKLKTKIVRSDFGCYSIVAPNGGVTEVTVGANGETLKTVNARGETVKQTYTADTLLESVIAPSGKRSKIGYDKYGLPISAMSPSGASTAFSYTPEFDNLASVTDAKGHAFNYGYDDKGRSTSVTYVDGSASSLEYNEKGDVAKSTNRRGESITYEYDAEGTLTKKTWPNGRTFTMTYDVKGNVTNATDSVTGAVTMEYDADERLTRIVYPKGRGFTYKYDAVGRVVERASLDGTKECYSYDSFGRLATVTDGATPYLTNAYDPTTGWLVTQTYGNGTIVSNAYDVLGRTIGIYHLRGNNRLAFFEYAYDEDGKCVSQTTAEGVESYTYDADGQLTGVTYPDGTSESFSYDAVGNRITANTTTYTVNNLNQYTTLRDSASPREENLEYDLDGNMTRNGDTLYYYDTLNRLVAVTNETKNIHWSCEYDVFGNRVSVTDNGTTTEKVFVQGSLPSVSAEYVNGTLTKRHILVGAVRLADIVGVMPSSATARYYHADLLGSARLLTDGTGTTKGMRSFKVFGETRKFDGETTDAGYVGTLGVETDSNGLLFMRNRYYDAGMGRFMQIDPVGINGQDYNLYRYCQSNPVMLIDPDGNSWKTGAAYALMSIADHANAVGSTLGATAGFPGAVGSFVIGVGAVLVKHGADLMLEDEGVLTSGEVLQNLMEGLGNAWFSSMIPDKLSKLWTLGNWIEGQWGDIKGYISWVLQSLDPNEISGSLGIGEKRYVEQGEWMNYTIYFENKTNATAAAQEVFVDLPMDENLDWSTLELGEIAFGDHIDTSLSGKSHGKASYAMPGTNTFVKTEVTMKDGVLSWYMRDWDPTTADNFPASATGGFLPPNDPDTHCGEGHLSFRVRVKDDAPDGAVINASATIVFDSNAPIETDPSWWNTVGTIHDVAIEIDGVTTNLTLIAGEPFGELPVPTQLRTGYTFDGWYTGENGTGTKATPDALVPAGDFTLYANWIANNYVIAYNANGGTGTMADQAFKYDETKALSAVAFRKAGHSFTGWATNETDAAVFADRAVVSNMTSVSDGTVALYARWTVNRYMVTFDAAGGEGGTSGELEYGSAITVPTVARKGYTFAGWSTAVAGTVPVDGATYVAAWNPITYKVRFNANGGTGTMADQAFRYGTAQKLSANTFKRSMYAFAGWATSPGGEVVYADGQSVENLAAMADCVVTLYAVWTMARPMLWDEVTGDTYVSMASVYNGYLYDDDGNVKGTILVKVGKLNPKTRLSTVKATVTLSDGKSKNLKAIDKGKAVIAPEGTTDVPLTGGDSCTVTLGLFGMSGHYGSLYIDGSRDYFSSRSKSALSTASAMASKWAAVNVAWDDGTMTVTIDKKGKAKIVGNLSSGTKVSSKSQLIIGENWCCVPVIWAKKKEAVAVTLWLPISGDAAIVSGLDGDVNVGAPEVLNAGAEFHIDADELCGLLGDSKYAEYLPDGVSVEQKGSKWIVAGGAKAGKVQVGKDGKVDDVKAGANPSALKFTYRVKGGIFNGSFKAYISVGGKPKAVTVNVTGVLVGGKGYGSATVKRMGSVAVTIE